MSSAVLSVWPGGVPSTEKGLQVERRVRESTRLDWEFAAGAGPAAGRVRLAAAALRVVVPHSYKPKVCAAHAANHPELNPMRETFAALAHDSACTS